MATGTFSLDQTWKPLNQVLAGKLNWAYILAEKNKVTLTVTDSTVASEFGIYSLLDGAQDLAGLQSL